YKDSPQVKYSDQDAAACDIKFWPKRNLDPETGNPVGPAIVAAPSDTINILDTKKFQADGVTPREIFKWPIKFIADGENNAKRADPNIRYEWQVRCACEHGVGPESPWSDVKIFNTPDFDPSTGIYSSSPDGNTTEYQKELGQSPLDISIYPNPFNGSEFHISSNRRISGIVEIYDMDGRTMFSTYVELKQSVGYFEILRPLEKGLYLLRISSSDDQYTTTIAVQ
ncbi:MAG: T9SS type A sorting domain-containing protein, partial [Flavobacteriales bacterium]|nr:T9SS type A sorting domain-containing protein [Flavobacteriales bacterium]